MKFTHEFDPHGFETFHRLVWVNPHGERIVGNWALYEAPAFLSVEEIGGREESELTPRIGFFALTDYYTSNGSLVAAYSALSGGPSGSFEVVERNLTVEEHKAEQAADGEADDTEFALAP